MRTWFITGCSTGFGKSLAYAVKKAGEQVVVTARRKESLEEFEGYENVLTLTLDVTSEDQIVDAVEKTVHHFGKIDILVNNAGYGFRGAVEEADHEEVEKIFSTNFFGPLKLIQTVLPYMRTDRSGTIINFSSIAAFRTAEGSAYYGATKAALESLSVGLSKEVGPLGIRVMIVEPGPFRTDFAGRSLAIAKKNISDYAETAGKRKERDDPHTEWRLGDPDKAADLLIQITKEEHLPLRLLLGSDAVNLARNYYSEVLNEVEQYSKYSESTDEDI